MRVGKRNISLCVKTAYTCNARSVLFRINNYSLRSVTLPAGASQLGRASLTAVGTSRRSRPLRFTVTSSSSGDILLRTLSRNGEVAILTLVGTGLVSEAAGRHKSAPTATAAIGRAMLGTLLLGAFRKDEEATQVTFKGDGPLGQVCSTVATSVPPLPRPPPSSSNATSTCVRSARLRALVGR